MPDEYGPWDSLSPFAAAQLMRAFAGRWWIAGGWCLEPDLDHPLREHGDVDIEVLRSEVRLLLAALPEWELHACRWPDGSVFHRWTGGEPLPPEVHDIWCRPGPDAPWAFQFMVLEDDGDRWIYRRDDRIDGPIADLTVLRNGIPMLTPEVQLLFKSKGRRPKDDQDFAIALATLDADRIAWLRTALDLTDPANPWLPRLQS